MRKRAAHRRDSLKTMFAPLALAWAIYASAAFLAHPAAILLFVVANALTMMGFCRGFGFDGGAVRDIARGMAIYGALFAAYAAIVRLIVLGPVHWLATDGSLSAALTVSGALVLALFVLWRSWPAFTLAFLPDDLQTSAQSRQPSRQGIVALAAESTVEPDVFFRCGAVAALLLLLLSTGALVLSGIGMRITGDTRPIWIAAYALILSPLAHWLLVNRTLRALLAHWHALRGSHADAVPSADTEIAPDADRTLPPQMSRDELDAALLSALRSTNAAHALEAIERGADANALPPADARDQRTPIMIAATWPDLRLLRALIAAGADVNRAQGGITPLIAATRDSYEGRPDAVTMLLANGADASQRDAEGNTPLHHASRCANPIIAALLLDTKVDIDAVNQQGHTALAIACGNANWPLAGFLLERRAATNVPDAVPALVSAAGIAEDDPTGVRLLVKHRAAVDATAPLGRTALMTAALAGHARIVDSLLNAGADADLADQRGTTALMEAARAGSVAAIHALGKRKVDVDRVDAAGRSALMHACQSRQADEESVRALLALGADRAVTAADGQRAVDLAAAAGRWPIVALLDPAYPVPSSLETALPESAADQPGHLLDALRFGHWNVAAEFSVVVRDWPAATLAALYLELSTDASHAAARNWLLNHGLDGSAIVDSAAVDGTTTLFDALVSRLPDSADALAAVLQRGVAVGGAGLVARVLESASGEQADAVRALARDIAARGGDLFGGTERSPSALLSAIAAGDAALVQTLLAAGCDPNLRDARGDTPLHLAVTRGAVDLARSLIAAGANPGIANACGETALGTALARSDAALAYWLAWPNWSLPLRPLRGADLPDAASEGDTGAVEKLLDLRFALDSEDAKGATALIRAAGAGHAALVVQLLDAGANVEHVTRSGVHVLAAAVAARREAIVRTLLNHRIAPDLRIAGGGTALALACALGETRIVDALLEAGADANAADEQGGTPLHAAAQYAFSCGDIAAARAIFERLLRAGAQIASRNRGGQDALLILLGAREAPGARCDAEHLRILCEWFVERGASIETQDARGVGALHACALHGLIGCARLLKAHGAPLDAIDAFGRTAAEVAALIGYVDVAAELGLPGTGTIPGVRQTLRRPARAPD